uniref:Uncharacterized protein n=1 Tax=Pyxicephalus adspersus TaxID=30357 RepID=A0AAV2ZXI6_PYXAD|nr:TPA: hypothetical protein GDO54_018164 [Pyxicephalus adspersus]
MASQCVCYDLLRLYRFYTFFFLLFLTFPVMPSYGREDQFPNENSIGYVSEENSLNKHTRFFVRIKNFFFSGSNPTSETPLEIFVPKFFTAAPAKPDKEVPAQKVPAETGYDMEDLKNSMKQILSEYNKGSIFMILAVLGTFAIVMFMLLILIFYLHRQRTKGPDEEKVKWTISEVSLSAEDNSSQSSHSSQNTQSSQST